MGENMSAQLPAGFTLDEKVEQPMGSSTLPEGFTIDEPESSFGDKALGVAENVASMASGIVAEPVAGIAGIAQSLNPFADEGAGSEAVKSVRDLLTYEPSTETGKEYQQNIGETLAPVGEVMQGAESFLGDNVLEITGSPALAALAHSLPTAALEILGVKGTKSLRTPNAPSDKLIQKSMLESAPEIEAIKSASRAIYKEIDDSGVTVKSSNVDRLINNIETNAKKVGLDPRLTDKTARAMKIIKESKGVNQPLTEIDSLREIASRTTKSLDDTEKAIGNLMLNEIDDFLDNLKPSELVGGTEAKAGVGKKFKTARKLWGRAKRGELLEEAITRGNDVAAGAESGIRNEFNRILRSKKQSKYIPEADQQLMRDVVKGDFKSNFTRMVGKFGLSLDRSPNVFQSIVGGGGIGFLGGGATGALAVPIIGTVSKAIAQKLTRGKADFAKKMTLAGKDGTDITRAYLQTVPKAKRSAQDLADLLSDPSVDLDTIKMIGNETFKDALDLAKGQRAINYAMGALSGSAIKQGDNQELRTK